MKIRIAGCGIGVAVAIGMGIAAWAQTQSPPPAAAGAAPDVALAPAPAVPPSLPEAPPPAEPPAEAKAAPAAPAEVVRVPVVKPDDSTRMNGDRVTLSLNDVPLSDVVNLFMRLSGANIVASPTQLNGRVSVNLRDIQWRTALNEILSMHGLTLYESQPGSMLYTITPPRTAEMEPLYTQTYVLQYARAESLSNGVGRLIAPQGSVLQANGKVLAILATTKQIERVAQIIERLDKMIPQVAIEAKFVELNDEAIKDLGINWSSMKGYTVTMKSPAFDYSRTDSKRGIGVNSGVDTRQSSVLTADGVTSKTDGTLNAGISGQGFTAYDAKENAMTIVPERDITTLKTSSAILSAADFAMTLSALQTKTGIEIVTNPKVVVSSGEEATIHIGEKRPNIVKRTTSTQGGTTDVSYEYGNPQWIEIGTLVKVQPVVNTASNITIKIAPELNRQIGEIEPQPGLTFPILVTRRVLSEFVLESGQTVAIGGLTSTEDRDVTSKIPFLGDIPLIGKYLFSHTSTKKEQDETVIFVTVKIEEPSRMDSTTGIPSHGALIYERFEDAGTGAIELRNQRRMKWEKDRAKARAEAAGKAGATPPAPAK